MNTVGRTNGGHESCSLLWSWHVWHIQPCTQASAITESCVFLLYNQLDSTTIWFMCFNCQCCYDHRRFLFSLSITNVSLPLQMWLRVVVLHEDYTLLSIFLYYFVVMNDLVECVQFLCANMVPTPPPTHTHTQYPYTHTPATWCMVHMHAEAKKGIVVAGMTYKQRFRVMVWEPN